MDQDRTKDWRELCKAAANEPDPEKLMHIITELNNVLDERDRKRKNPLSPTNCRVDSLSLQREVTL